MAKSATTEEDAAWTQTFVTVTPQDDGFLREIEENVVVSGVADTPLHLDTGNIVMRRSLMNNAKNFINPAELEPLKRIAAECQTYLQGVPKVELPLVYKDEATQTLYMRSDGQRTAAVRSLGSMIAVMNEKPLPELKTTRIVQTTITFDAERSSYDDITEQLQSDVGQAENDDPEFTARVAGKESAAMEAADILNFVIDRTMWMAEPEPAPRKEQKDAEAQTYIKYNNSTNKVTMDHEAQTSLSCAPKHSNTMLLFEYKEAKSCCRFQLEDCLAKGVYPRMMIDDTLDKIMARCHDQINFPCQEAAINIPEVTKPKKIHQTKETACPVTKCPARCVGKVCPKLNPKTRRIDDTPDKIMARCHYQINFRCQEEAAINIPEVTKTKKTHQPKETACPVTKCPAKCVGKVCPKLNPKTRRTEDILLADNPSYVVRAPSSGEADPSLKPSCPPLTKVYAASTTSQLTLSLQDSSSSQSVDQGSSESRRTLTDRDEEALGLLKNAFCQIGTCNKR